MTYKETPFQGMDGVGWGRVVGDSMGPNSLPARVRRLNLYIFLENSEQEKGLLRQRW